jgi:hypothetical protein
MQGPTGHLAKGYHNLGSQNAHKNTINAVRYTMETLAVPSL